MALFTILRKFSDGTREYGPSEVVDLDGRNVEKLVAQRYIAPASPDAKTTVKPKTKVSRVQEARAE